MQIYVNVEWFALWVRKDLWAFGLQVLKAVRKTWRFAGQLDRDAARTPFNAMEQM